AASLGRIDDGLPIRMLTEQKTRAVRVPSIHDRPRSRHRRQASAWAYLQAGGPHAAGAADHWSQCLSASAANARCQRSVAAGSACAPPYKVVMVALAAKTARIIWAMLAKGEPYRGRASALAAA